MTGSPEPRRVHPAPPTRDERLALVRARLEDGYYERTDVARAIARRLLVDLVGKEPPSA